MLPSESSTHTVGDPLFGESASPPTNRKAMMSLPARREQPLDEPRASSRASLTQRLYDAIPVNSTDFQYLPVTMLCQSGRLLVSGMAKGSRAVVRAVCAVTPQAQRPARRRTGV